MSRQDFDEIERRAVCEHGIVSCNVCVHGKCYACGHDAHSKDGCFEPTPEEAPGACLCDYAEGA